jgi:FkbM family methyltransferase
MIRAIETPPESSEFEPVELRALRFPGPREIAAASGGRLALRGLLRTRGEERRAVARDVAFRLAGSVTDALAVEADGIRFHLNTRDREISRIVFIYGMYDRPLMHAAFTALRRLGGAGGFGGRSLLDVGANIGTTTLTACAHFGAGGAIAVEPEPTNLRFLDMNVRANGLTDRVRVHAAAASDHAGTVVLERSDYNAGDHRVRPGLVESDASDGHVEVAAITVDELIASGEFDPADVGAAWIDVQGHEGHVLAGASKLLEAGVPVAVEFWPHGLREAGGFELFRELVVGHFRELVDLGRPQDGPASLAPVPVSSLARLADRYGAEDDHTDLLLVPPSLSG